MKTRRSRSVRCPIDILCNQNILVSGATQSGKTTLLGALLASARPAERIVTVEETFELDLQAQDVVSMQCRQPSLEGTGEITLRRLIKEALRMRPDRLVVGEVREAESLDLLLALNSGLPGACSVHANSAREALIKLCTLPLLAGRNIDSSLAVRRISSHETEGDSTMTTTTDTFKSELLNGVPLNIGLKIVNQRPEWASLFESYSDDDFNGPAAPAVTWGRYLIKNDHESAYFEAFTTYDADGNQDGPPEYVLYVKFGDQELRITDSEQLEALSNVLMACNWMVGFHPEGFHWIETSMIQVQS